MVFLAPLTCLLARCRFCLLAPSKLTSQVVWAAVRVWRRSQRIFYPSRQWDFKEGELKNDFAWFFHGSFFLSLSVTLRSNQLTFKQWCADFESFYLAISNISRLFQLIACNIQLDTHLEVFKWFLNDPLITWHSMTLFCLITLNSCKILGGKALDVFPHNS